MKLFWLKRMKEERGGSSWATSFGDLMSLLLAVFVMITAMSELYAGSRFDEVNSSVREAFGFGVAGDTDAAVEPSLFERLEEAGLDLDEELRDRLSNVEPVLAACQVVRRGEAVVIQLPGAKTFSPFNARLHEPAKVAVARISEFLVGGKTCIEIRGHAADGPLPDDSWFRDALDLSYARARAVAEELARGGVSRDRLAIAACGNVEIQTPDAGPASGDSGQYVEIVVHPRPGLHVRKIAVKGIPRNG